MTGTTAKSATILGIVALLMWNSMFGFLRSVTEHLGALRAAAAIYLLSGLVGYVLWAVKTRKFNLPGQFTTKYLIICGLPFVMYMLTFQLAIGWAVSRQQTIEVTLLNYLWPAMTMLFMIPILKYKARPMLLPGIFIALFGVFLTVKSGADFSWSQLVQNFHTSTVPYLLAIMSAVCWGLYSNLTRIYASQAKTSAVPLMMFLSGLIFMGMYLLSGENTSPVIRSMSTRTLLEFLYVTLGPCLLAYVFWDMAMKRGNIVLVASLSYLSPLLSVVFTALYLHIELSRQLWVTCLMIIAGAVICKFSVIEPKVQADKNKDSEALTMAAES